MKTLIVATFVLFGIKAHALDCQNLAGDYFFNDNIMRTMHIDQNGCELTITNETDGNIGAPMTFSGDSSWGAAVETEGFQTFYRSTAGIDSYLIETRMVDTDSGEESLQKDVYKLRSNGDIIMSSTITMGEITQSGFHLLVRE